MAEYEISARGWSLDVFSKQKTAYEISTRDWSSDVCSSDLNRCDVAVGSRFVSGDGYEPYRYRPSAARRLGTGLLRRLVSIFLRQPFADATSGLYAVNHKALPLLASPYTSGAPEVEALIRI